MAWKSISRREERRRGGEEERRRGEEERRREKREERREKRGMRIRYNTRVPLMSNFPS